MLVGHNLSGMALGLLSLPDGLSVVNHLTLVAAQDCYRYRMD